MDKKYMDLSLTAENLHYSFFSLNVYFHSISSIGAYPNVVYFYTWKYFIDVVIFL